MLLDVRLSGLIVIYNFLYDFINTAYKKYCVPTYIIIIYLISIIYCNDNIQAIYYYFLFHNLILLCSYYYLCCKFLSLILFSQY